MKVSVSFEELTATLGYAGTILGDKSVEEKMKNLIFLVTPESVKLVAYNAFIFSRTTLSESSIDLEGAEKWSFQVKAADINRIVSSFSSLYRTKVSTLDFSADGVRIKLTVHEEPKDGESERLAQDSSFYLENAPIIKKIEDEIYMLFPEEGDSVAAGDLLLYLDTLFPLVSNDKASVIGSKFNFADDYVFVINGSMSAFMPNKLPDSFKGLSISYSSASFVKKLTEKADLVNVARMEKYLCIQEGATDAFIRLQKVTANYKVYISKFAKDKGIVIDRLYFRDVLKRMSAIEANGVVEVISGEEGYELSVSNSNFNQMIPINNAKNIENVKFSVSVPIWEKTILGKDDVFTGDVFIYFVDTQRGYIIFMSDKTGAWMSNTQVTKV